VPSAAAAGGIYQSSDLGPWVQNPLLALTSPLLRGRRVIFPLPREGQAITEHLRDLLATGAFTPVVDRHDALADIVEAYRYVETGQKVGNVVIDVAST
jgi:NADPH:quinone reductase-like Zn-dependent oxidoreductase